MRTYLAKAISCIGVCCLGLYLISSPAWAQEFRTGCILNPELYQKAPLAASLMRGDFSKLPLHASLHQYAPIPQNQGAYGTCVGWSTAYAARTILMAYDQGWTNQILITENAFSPFFIYEQAKSVDDIYCQEGTSLFNALEIIKNIGAVRISEFDSQCGQMITNNDEQKASRYRIQDYKRLFDTDVDNKTLLIKKSLAENKPVIIGMQCCTESFLNAKGEKFWEKQITDNPYPEGGHALTIVGYDDERYGGAFELMNSWGTAWGDEGFIWMSYTDIEQYCFEAYEMSIKDAEEFLLEGDIQLVLSNGSPMLTLPKDKGLFEVSEPYFTGTLFQLQINNEKPAYVYALGADEELGLNPLFPQNNQISPYLSYRGNRVALPGEDTYAQIVGEPGTDYLCILYSREELNIGEIRYQFSLLPHLSFYDRIQEVLGEKLIPQNAVEYISSDAIKFQAQCTDKQSVLPIVVAIRHN